jgi:hypothetical protein
MTMLYNVTLSVYSESAYKYISIKTVQIKASDAASACELACIDAGRIPGLAASASPKKS